MSMLDLLTIPRTLVQCATAMLRANRGLDERGTQHLLWFTYVMAFGDPTVQRQPWQFQGPGLIEMMRGPRLRRIPRELRRIYAPLP